MSILSFLLLLFYIQSHEFSYRLKFLSIAHETIKLAVKKSLRANHRDPRHDDENEICETTSKCLHEANTLRYNNGQVGLIKVTLTGGHEGLLVRKLLTASLFEKSIEQVCLSPTGKLQVI